MGTPYSSQSALQFQSSFWRPAKFKNTLINGSVRQVTFSAPIGKRHSFVAEAIKKVSARIVHLRAPISPATILWCVISICIYAIYAHSFWGLSHVLKESWIAIPFLTNLYPSTAIIWIVAIGCVIASLAHAFPYFVGTAFVRHAVSSGKSDYLLSRYLRLPASARLAYPACQLVLSHDSLCAAFAFTKKATAMFQAGFLKNGPAMKFFSYHLKSFVRRGYEIIIPQYKKNEVLYG